MKHVVFLVHGIGRHAQGPLGTGSRTAWADEVVAALESAAASYPKFKSSQWKLVPVLYDDVFFTHVKKWAELADSLQATPAAALTSWMLGAAQPDFLFDSIGDVILYRAFPEVREHIMTTVARQFVDEVAAHGTEDCDYSIVCHSLGTAVAHDTVQKLATVGIDGNTAMLARNFSFNTFCALANVSRLVWATDKRFYDDTVVRPRNCGLPAEQCAVEKYLTFRHVADPVPSIVRFVRKGWTTRLYGAVDVQHLRAANVHGFTHYLQNPFVSGVILNRILGSATVPMAEVRKRARGFADFEEPKREQKQKVVAAAQVALDGICAQADGRFELDIDEIGQALIDLAPQLEGVFA